MDEKSIFGAAVLIWDFGDWEGGFGWKGWGNVWDGYKKGVYVADFDKKLHLDGWIITIKILRGGEMV